MSLNESQQRAVAVALRQLEERLGRIEDIIERDESGALFHRSRPKWSREETERVGAIREIAGVLRVAWESLAEVDNRRLRSYGRVDPGLRGTLDPALERMMALVSAMEEIAVGVGAEDDAPPEVGCP